MSNQSAMDRAHREELGQIQEFIREMSEKRKPSELIVVLGAKSYGGYGSDLEILLKYVNEQNILAKYTNSPQGITYILLYDPEYTKETIESEVDRHNDSVEGEEIPQLSRVSHVLFRDEGFPMVYSFGPECFLFFSKYQLRSTCLEDLSGLSVRERQAEVRRIGLHPLIARCAGKKGPGYAALETVAENYFHNSITVYNCAWLNTREPPTYNYIQENRLFEMIPETLYLARYGCLLFRKTNFNQVFTGQKDTGIDDLQKVCIHPETEFVPRQAGGKSRRRGRKSRSYRKRTSRKH